MKEYLWLVLILTLVPLSGCNTAAVPGSGNIVRETRAVQDVRAVRLESGGTLIISQADRESIIVEADENLLPYIHADVEEGHLALTTDNAIHPSRGIVYHLTVRELEAVTLRGSGEISASSLESETLSLHLDGSGQIVLDELSAASLDVVVEGSGQCTVAGRAAEQTVTIEGSGNYLAGDLESRSGAVNIKGSGNVTMWVQDRLDVGVSGDARVAYFGQPQLNRQIAGQAEIVSLGAKEATFQWRAFATTAEAGYSQAALSQARSFYDDLGAAAALVVVEGKILANWGDTNRRFFNASVRKGFLNALVGIAVERGQIDLDQTVGEAGIDDIQPLTEVEKSATLQDLITARSGIYHPGAFEDQVWKARRPARGSSAPGERWFYNNWDFNVLGHVYEQATGMGIFEAFAQEIATPLQMQDYRLLDGVYYEEPDVSRYPAYLFKTSARDMARFGLLYLNEGLWQGQRVLAAQWIARSLQPASVVFDDGTGFGYLWWHTTINGHDAYFTNGAGTQGIYVVPDYDLVYVFRDNTYDFERIADADEQRLLSLIMDARTGQASPAPLVTAVTWPHRLPGATPANARILREHFGTYTNERLGPIMLKENEGTVLLELKRGRFRVLQSEGGFLLEDLELPLLFVEAAAREGQADFEVGEALTLYIE